MCWTHAAPLMGAGSKMGIDATTKWAEEGYQREWPQELQMSDDVIALVDESGKNTAFNLLLLGRSPNVKQRQIMPFKA